MALPDLSSMDDRDIFFTVLRNSIGNVIWYGIAAIVIVLIGRISWWLGVILFAMFVLVSIIGILQTIFVTLLGVVMIPFSIYEHFKGRTARGREQLYLGAGNLIQLLEVLIFAGYIFWLFKRFF